MSVGVSNNLVFTTSWDVLRIVDASNLIAPRQVGSYRLPGTTGRFAVSGNFVYVSSAAGLEIVDISDTANPQRVGRYTSDTMDVAIDGAYAFLAATEGLVALDVSDPTNPRRIATYNLNPTAVSLTGHLALIVAATISSDSLHVIDISNPSALRRLGGCALSGPTASPGRRPEISGNYACVPTVAGMDVIDISNPADPRLVSTYKSTSIQDVAFSGNIAYAAGEDGVQVIDLSSPAQPRLVGGYQTCGNALGIAVIGIRAFTVGDSGLQILDLNSREKPQLVSRQGLCGSVQNVAVSGTYAYVAEGAGGILVVDVGDPTQPRSVATYETQSFAHAVKLAGGFAYVAGGESGLEIVDIQNPSLPWRVATLDTASIVWDVAISRNYACLAAGSRGLLTVDITHPASPIWGGSYSGATAKAVAVSGGYAYVAADTGGLLVLDVRKPQNDMSLVGNWIPSNPRLPNPRVERVAVDGNVAWVAVGAADYSGTHLIDVTDPSHPVELATVGGDGGNVAFSGHHAYLCDSALKMFDVARPSEPQLVGQTAQTDYAQSVAVQGNFAYVGAYESGWVLRVVAIDPANPQRLAVKPINGGVSWNGVAVVGDFAYVADEVVGLQVLSVTNRASPQRVGSYSTSALRVAISGNLACVAAGSAGLKLLDIQDPAHPKLTGGYDTPGTAWDVAISDGFAYVADYDGGLQVIDIRTPDSPQRVGGYKRSSEGAVSVALSGNLAAVADTLVPGDRTGGLVLLDISNRASPQFLGRWDGGEALGVAISGTFAFVIGSGSFGSNFEVIDIGNPAKPRRVGHTSNVTGSALTIDGKYAYVWGAQGVAVLDISNPTHAQRVGGNSAMVGFYGSIAVSGNHVFVPNHGLTILDSFRPVRLQPLWGPGQGILGLRLEGPRSVEIRLQRSTNLKEWEPWQVVTLGDVQIDIPDSQAVTTALRFYRAAQVQP